jgi:hypothetical protein
VDVKEVVNPDGEVHRITEPVDPAAGWDMLGSRRGEIRAGAVGFSLRGRSMSNSARIDFDGDLACACMPPSDELLQERLAPQDTDTVDSMLAVFDDSGTTETDFSPEAVSRDALDSAKAFTDTKRKQKRRAASVVNLSAYRQRAEELRQRLEQTTDRQRELGMLAQRLEELIDDLKSIGAPESERQPLAELLAELRTFLANVKPSEKEIRTMGEKCNEVLEAFGGGKKDAARGKAFWK